jgi:hypothetical protein
MKPFLLLMTGVAALLMACTTPPPKTYSLETDPKAIVVNRDDSASLKVNIKRSNFSEKVTLSVDNPPAGLTVASVASEGDSADLSFVANSNASVGSYTVTVRGVAAGGLSRDTTVDVTVAAPPSFRILPINEVAPVNRGRSTSVNVSIVRLSGFAGPVTLNLLNPPAGLSSSGTVVPAGSSSASFSLKTAEPLAAGSVNFSLQGSANSEGKVITRNGSGSLSLTANPELLASLPNTTVTGLPNNAALIPLQLQRLNGFNSTLVVTVAAPLPQGVSSESFDITNVANPAAGLILGGSVVNGSYPLNVVISSAGSTLFTLPFTLTITGALAQSFDLTLSPSPISLARTTSKEITVAVTRSVNFIGAISLPASAWSNLPAGVTATAASIAANATSATVTLSASNSASIGNSLVTVLGTGQGLAGPINRSSSPLDLTVTGVPTFAFVPTLSSASVLRGQSSAFMGNLTAINGFSGSVSFSLINAPTGVSITAAPVLLNTTASAAISIGTSANTPLGLSNFTIRATSGGEIKDSSFALTVNPLTDFALAAPESLIVAATPGALVGVPTTFLLTITPSNGFVGNVVLGLTGAPAGTVIAPANFIVTGTLPIIVPITLTLPSGVVVGSTAISIQGVQGDIVRSSNTITLNTVAASFSATLGANALSVPRSGVSALATSISQQNGSTAAVGFAISNAPAGLTINPIVPAPVLGAMPITPNVVFAATNAVPAGVYNVLLTITAGGYSRSLPVAVTVTSIDFAATLSSSSLAVSAGSAASTSLSVTPLAGFTGAVTLSLSSAPVGVSVTPFSFNIPGTTTVTQVLSINTTAATPQGISNIILNVAGGGLTKTIPITLNVTAPSATSKFSLSTSQANPSGLANSTVNVPLTISPLAGFTGMVALGLQNAPAGISLTSPFSVNIPDANAVASNLSLQVTAGVVAGNYPITIVANGGGVSGSLNIILTVTAAP